MAFLHCVENKFFNSIYLCCVVGKRVEVLPLALMCVVFAKIRGEGHKKS